jgi:uncharacterized protein involved in propanediol utilization
MIEGRGIATSHHGELLQGAFCDCTGRLRRGLVTVPCPIFSSAVEFRPKSGVPFAVQPDYKWKAMMAAKTTLQHLGLPGFGGELTVTTTIAEKVGLGSSTADVLATIRAVAAAFQVDLDRNVIARLAVQAERAVDPLMFDDQPVLFAHREGSVISWIAPNLPPLHIVGFIPEAMAAGVDTLAHALPDYSQADLETFDRLFELLRRGITGSDYATIGLVSTESAKLNQKYIEFACFSELISGAARFGAAGIQISHSGSVAGIIFDPQCERAGLERKEIRRFLSDMGAQTSWQFMTGGGASIGASAVAQ